LNTEERLDVSTNVLVVSSEECLVVEDSVLETELSLIVNQDFQKSISTSSTKADLKEKRPEPMVEIKVETNKTMLQQKNLNHLDQMVNAWILRKFNKESRM